MLICTLSVHLLLHVALLLLFSLVGAIESIRQMQRKIQVPSFVGLGGRVKQYLLYLTNNGNN